MDTVYPEPMSRLHHRTVRKQCRRTATDRYRTQPVTFQEIKEVDEENLDDRPCSEQSAAAASKSELDLNLKFEEFWRLGREKVRERKKKRPTREEQTPADTLEQDSSEDLQTLVGPPAKNKLSPRTSI